MDCDYFALLRHMEAANNAAEKAYTCGVSDAYEKVVTTPSSLHDLTRSGVEQAVATGDWLKKKNLTFTRHITSSFLRAMRTAMLLDIFDASWEIEDRICEKDGGLLNTMKPEEVEVHLDDSVQKRHLRDSYRYRPERGESFLDLDTRSRPFFDSLSGRPLVVCHGHLIRCVDRIKMRGQCSWDFGSYKNTRNDLPNGVLIEYRRNRKGWWDRRVSVPCQGSEFGTWEAIELPMYSNEALGRLIEKVRAL
jgi:broad specificity phosphatase PhoE